MDPSITPYEELNREFGRLTCSPTSNNGRTPGTPASKNENSPLCSSSQRKRGVWGNLKNTLKSRPPGYSVDDGKETPQPLGRRKSLRNIFSSIRSVRHNGSSEDAEIVPKVERSDTISPSKECDSPEQEDRPIATRRKSFSDILGTISNSVRRNSKQSTGLLQVYPGVDSLIHKGKEADEDVEDQEEVENVSGQSRVPPSNPLPVQSLSVQEGKVAPKAMSRSKSPELAPRIPIPAHLTEGSYKDSFGARISIERIADEYKQPYKIQMGMLDGCLNDSYNSTITGSDKTLVESSMEAINKDETENTGRKTPDSYLQSLIETQVDAHKDDCLHTGEEKSHWSSNSSDASGTAESCTPPDRVLENQQRLHRELIIQEALATSKVSYADETREPGALSQSSRHPLVTIREIAENALETTSLAECNDVDPEYHQRSGLRQLKYEALQLDPDDIGPDLKKALARMTKNFYLPSSPNESCTSEHDDTINNEKVLADQSKHEVEMWKNIYAGRDILHQPRDKGNRPSFPSDSNLSRNVLFESADNAILSNISAINETQEGIASSPKKERDHAHPAIRRDRVPKCLVFKPILQRRISNSMLNKDSAIISEITQSSLYELASAETNALSDSPPICIQFPESAQGGKHIKVCPSKSAAIISLFRLNQGEFDSFCTYDPKAFMIYVHLANTFVPDFAALSSKELEIIWLPPYEITDVDQPAQSQPTQMVASLDSKKEMAERNFPIEANIPDPCMSRDDGSVFDDDFFLENPDAETDIAISGVGSQYFDTEAMLGEAKDFEYQEMLNPGQEDRDLLLSLDNDSKQVPEIPTWAQLARRYKTAQSTKALSDPGKLMSKPKSALEAIDSEETGGTAINSPGVVTSLGGYALQKMDENDGYHLIQGIWMSLPWKSAESMEQTDMTDSDRLERCFRDIVDDDGYHVGREIWISLPWRSKMTEMKRSWELRTENDQVDYLVPCEETSMCETPHHEKNTCPTTRNTPIQELPQGLSNIQDVNCVTPERGSIRQRQSKRVASVSQGFKFSEYREELEELSPGSRNTSVKTIELENSSGDTSDNPTASSEALDTTYCGGVEFQKVSSDWKKPWDITMQDLNIRPIGKVARAGNLPIEEVGKISALVDIFQSHGLMQQSLRPMLSGYVPRSVSPVVNNSGEIGCSSSIDNNSMCEFTPHQSEGEISFGGHQRDPSISTTCSDATTETSSTFGESLKRMKSEF